MCFSSLKVVEKSRFLVHIGNNHDNNYFIGDNEKVVVKVIASSNHVSLINLREVSKQSYWVELTLPISLSGMPFALYQIRENGI